MARMNVIPRKAAWHDGKRWRGVFDVTPGFQNRLVFKLHGKVMEFDGDSQGFPAVGKWNSGHIHFEQAKIEECLVDLKRQEQVKVDALAAREAFRLTLGYKIAALSAIDTEEAGERWNRLGNEKLQQIVTWLNEAGVRV